jgi:hypothetical protein
MIGRTIINEIGQHRHLLLEDDAAAFQSVNVQ